MPSITIKKDNKTGNWLLDPGEIHSSTGAEVTWQAQGTAATIWFPDANLFGQSLLKLTAGQSAKLKVKTSKHGSNPYAVFCHDGGHFAYPNNGTEPVVIVP